ncbi:hypothetical protein CR513_23979, partial [Mucuna pruriens]
MNCIRLAKFEPTINAMRISKLIAIGKMFSMNIFDNLILGECNIVGNFISILFDLGDTHSFISYDYIDRLS